MTPAFIPRSDRERGEAVPITGLEGFLETLVKMAGARGGAIRALTTDGKYLQLIAAIGLPPEFVQRELMVGVCGMCGEAVQDDDVHDSQDYAGCSALKDGCLAATHFHRAMAVPLEYRDEPVGVFNLFYDRDQVSRPEVEHLLRPIGQLLGLTLENSRLERENARASLVNERQIMAAEIHDSLAQSLAFARMRLPLMQDAVRKQDQVRSFRYCGELNEELGSAHQRLRELITHFRAGMDPNGLIHSLQETSANFFERSGIVLEFRNELPDLQLPIEHEIQIFYIIQEALANIRKHSQAHHASLSLVRRGDDIIITVEDDGCGSVADETAELANGDLSESCHFGLKIMRERAGRFGGSVQFENLPDGGARVRVRVPGAQSGGIEND
jgi:two-component system nitrate/nitrite sensor histidine kinase NarX